jgi:hypothetical protein
LAAASASSKESKVKSSAKQIFKPDSRIRPMRKTKYFFMLLSPFNFSLFLMIMILLFLYKYALAEKKNSFMFSYNINVLQGKKVSFIL